MTAGVAHEEGNLNDIRAILGNDVAIEAYGSGKIKARDDLFTRHAPWSRTRFT